jgi:hypothetical protein
MGQKAQIQSVTDAYAEACAKRFSAEVWEEQIPDSIKEVFRSAMKYNSLHRLKVPLKSYEAMISFSRSFYLIEADIFLQVLLAATPIELNIDLEKYLNLMIVVSDMRERYIAFEQEIRKDESEKLKIRLGLQGKPKTLILPQR